MPSSHLILCHPLLLLPPIPPSIRVFSNGSTLRMRWPKYWSLSFSISSSNEHPGLISFRMDWMDLIAVQGTLKSLLQHHSSKASNLRRSAFFLFPSHVCSSRLVLLEIISQIHHCMQLLVSLSLLGKPQVKIAVTANCPEGSKGALQSLSCVRLFATP